MYGFVNRLISSAFGYWRRGTRSEGHGGQVVLPLRFLQKCGQTTQNLPGEWYYQSIYQKIVTIYPSIVIYLSFDSYYLSKGS